MTKRNVFAKEEGVTDAWAYTDQCESLNIVAWTLHVYEVQKMLGDDFVYGNNALVVKFEQNDAAAGLGLTRELTTGLTQVDQAENRHYVTLVFAMEDGGTHGALDRFKQNLEDAGYTYNGFTGWTK